MDAAGAGTYTGASPAILNAGLSISSYYLHSDRIGESGTPLTFAGSITFAQRILGVIATANKLTASSYLENPSTGYSTNALRDYELSGQEFFIISADEKTLTFQCRNTDSADQLRIITEVEAVPEPISLIAMSITALGLVARKRKTV